MKSKISDKNIKLDVNDIKFINQIYVSPSHFL